MRATRTTRLRACARAAALAAALLAGCAAGGGGGAGSATGSAGPATTGAAEGRVRLVPREGVTPGHAGSGSYGDRRLRDVTFVDYDRPGFAVVWAESDPPAASAASNGPDVRIAVQDGPAGPRLAPEHAALARGASVVVRNDTRSAHTLSCPAAGLLKRLAPGASVSLPATAAGPLSVFLLGAAPVEAVLFVAPGPFAVTRPDGAYELSGLPPGPVVLHAWHPRFPPAAAGAVVRAGERVRLDLALRVDAERSAGASGEAADAQR